MRNAFAHEMVALAATDERVVLLSGDIGNRLFDPFKERFPERFFNVGVAEANMIGVAAGMAMSGLRPVVYTIAAFATLRCLEQIRVDVCYHRQPVVIVGVGAGLSYASLGATHHACEDIGCLRLLPGLAVVCPADALEVRAALRASLSSAGPTYLRLGKKGEPVVHAQPPSFEIGRALPLREGMDVALLSVGTMLPTSMAAADLLSQEGLSVELTSFHTVKPLDERYLAEAFARCRLVATIEEHSTLGGAGGAVAEWLVTQPPTKAILRSFGSEDRFLHSAGSQRYARAQYGLTAEAIATRILTELAQPSARR